MVISVLAVLSLSLGGDMVFWESHAGNEKANRFYADTIGAEHVTGEEQLLTWKLRRGALEEQVRRYRSV